jgi:hypothetical protein
MQHSIFDANSNMTIGLVVKPGLKTVGMALRRLSSRQEDFQHQQANGNKEV